MAKRIIGHLDMDAFFAAVEEQNNPRLRGLPIVVGADPQEGKGRGVVSTANYKAREYGIRSALPISRAWRFSEAAKKLGKPAAVFVFPHFEKYTEISQRIVKIVKKHVVAVAPASIDEMYFDLSFTGSYLQAKKRCENIKNEIKSKENLTASIGVGPNKLIAKLASDFEKPDGLTIVKEKDVQLFLDSLAIRKLPGIGPKTEAILNVYDVKTIKDLRRVTRSKLEGLLGKWGTELYHKARGQDNSRIEEEHITKSIGEQETFARDTLEPNFIIDRMSRMCADVMRRLKQEGFKNFRTVVITVRFADFQTLTRSHSISKPAASLQVLRFEAIKLIMPFLDKRENPKRKRIRLVGVRVEKLHQ